MEVLLSGLLVGGSTRPWRWAWRLGARAVLLLGGG